MKTTSGSLLFFVAAVISAAVVLASAYLYHAQPARPWPYALAILVMGVAWTARYLVRGNGDGNDASQARQRKLTQAIVLAGLLLAMPLIARLGWSAGFGPGIEARASGVMMGAIVAIFANVIPKQVSSARGLRMRRLAGRALVFGGAGYALAWLSLPIAYANVAALLILLLAVAYAASRIVWLVLKHRPASTG